MLVAYTLALGFLPAILGIVSISMGSATLCGCCGAKAGQVAAAPVGGVVVAAPVGGVAVAAPAVVVAAAK